MSKDPILMVSICCSTYNHEKFIVQALEGFLMQKTTFEFEIVVGNDCSTDNSIEILKEYQKKHPKKINLIIPVKNQGAHKNFINTVKHAQGKYIALCEGDDYWTDAYKLQKQVDFLEKNSEYIICGHYSRVINDCDQTLYTHPKPVALEYSYQDLLLGKQEETKTASLMYKNITEIHHLFKKPWFLKCYAGDKMFRLFATSVTGKKIYVIPEVMSSYRNHVGGIWSMIDPKVRTNMMISDFNLIIKHFTYPSFQKKKLLFFYVKRYLLFELRHRKLDQAYNTIKFLL